MNLSIEGDSFPEAYEMLEKHTTHIIGVDGLTCEIGVRRGMGSKSIMSGCIKNNDIRTHVCIDPYGNIITDNPIYGEPRRHDHTNSRKMECITSLHKYAFENNVNLIFFPLEDIEFFTRFSDGIPVYNEEKKIINKYAYVHIDGAHNYQAAEDAAKFFVKRMDSNSVLIFDNCDHYDHSEIELKYLGDYIMFDEYHDSHKKFYKKK